MRGAPPIPPKGFRKLPFVVDQGPARARAEEMEEPIRVDLESAQKCKAVDMIDFLLAFCLSGKGKSIPVRDERVLLSAFEKVKEVANQEGTTLRTELSKFLKAGTEAEMYDPFVIASNYALDQLSKVDIQGLPQYSADKQIVFVCNHNHTVKSLDLNRDCRTRPDIVLLQWESFRNLACNASDTYSCTYGTQMCTAGSKNLELAWKKVRSTVEVKFDRLPKQVSPMRSFNNNFKDLKESELCSSFDNDVSSTGFIRHVQPELKYGSRGSDRVAARKGPVTSEHISEWAYSRMKRKTEALNDHNTTKRSKTGGDAAGSSERPAVPQKHPVHIQNGIYAAERLSCSLDITHAINFILQGSKIYITWSDRQSVIRTGGFDITNDLPHFLLVLLIMQRFDLARWGFFTAFEGSSIYPERGPKDSVFFKATFIQDATIHIFPDDDLIYGGVNLTGRSTVVAGARKADGSNPNTSVDIREANNLVTKASWPEESRASEVKIIERAMQIGKTNSLVEDHIPTMHGNIDPPYVTCSTRFIREFLKLDTTGARLLRLIILDRLGELKHLDEEDVLIAYLDCFFCHWGLWEGNLCHGDISTGNLMYKPGTNRGVLIDFDLGLLDKQKGPSGKDNTGTMPFMALDLLSVEALKGSVPRLYRHDSESFAWCLIYICICMDRGDDGKILTISPHPLSSWFKDPGNCLASKTAIETATLLVRAPLHQRYTDFAAELHDYWVQRFNRQTRFNRQMAKKSVLFDHDPFKEDLSEDVPEVLLAKDSKATPEEYKEPSDLESFRDVCLLIPPHRHVIPKSKGKIFAGIMGLVANRCLDSFSSNTRKSQVSQPELRDNAMQVLNGVSPPVGRK
ncbi:uncharacterized protein EI90DRAFT_3293795 [Cantharellus anzutake]|uniref:uncharacterized protein n=1 Tax=Cantharellus anzutake TaxID=1750568 RepID=UPI0019043659|nr:uncharacterized protein EI90DRAFT_3293795 [Cantharellus anzutake]KAF8315998.1 hypothetical protein EI90DRAFT_3293795 [Cantharellus anzutake]